MRVVIDTYESLSMYIMTNKRVLSDLRTKRAHIIIIRNLTCLFTLFHSSSHCAAKLILK